MNKTLLYALFLIANHEELTDSKVYESGSIYIEEHKTYYNAEDIASAALTPRYNTHLYKVLKTRAEKWNQEGWI